MRYGKLKRYQIKPGPIAMRTMSLLNLRLRPSLMALAIVAAAATAALAGAPLKGIDVKLGKNPGGGLASRVTDAGGQFDFGVVPKGSYRITISVPAADNSAGQQAIELVVYGASGKPKTSVFQPAPASTARKSGAVIAADFVDVVADGVHPLMGSVSTAG